jgi:hypothetical protein
MAEKGKDEKTTKKPESEKDKEFSDPNFPEEGAKDVEEVTGTPGRQVVRGEDVLEILRAKGVKV